MALIWQEFFVGSVVQEKRTSWATSGTGNNIMQVYNGAKWIDLSAQISNRRNVTLHTIIYWYSQWDVYSLHVGTLYTESMFALEWKTLVKGLPFLVHDLVSSVLAKLATRSNEHLWCCQQVTTPHNNDKLGAMWEYQLIAACSTQ